MIHNRRSHIVFWPMALLAVTFPACAVNAGPSLGPPGLEPDDHYQLAFVTDASIYSEARNAASLDISDHSFLDIDPTNRLGAYASDGGLTALDGLSDVLTVGGAAVPERVSLTSFAIGLAGLAAARPWRRYRLEFSPASKLRSNSCRASARPKLMQGLSIIPLLAVLGLADTASAQGFPPGVQVSRDLPYARNGSGNLLDLYLPMPMKPRVRVPLIIWVHGGGWEMGTKEVWPAIFLVDKGYAVASINYRLSDEAIFPAQIYDCKAAVRWLRFNARKLNLDPERFGVWGGSAGGHLAALLGTSGDVKELEGSVGDHLKTSSRVQAVCDWFGPTDLAQFVGFRAAFPGLPPDYPNLAVTKLLGGTVERMKVRARNANPIAFISDKEPPFLIMHGDRDNLVPIEQSRLLERALQKAGAEVDLQVIPGKGHEMFNDHAVLRQVEKFFHKALRNRDGGKDEPDAKLLATYSHRAGGPAPGPVAFYSNGRLMSPDGINTWALKGTNLVLCWYDGRSPTGVWVDTCSLSKDGERYRGQNQQGDPILGVKSGGDGLITAVRGEKRGVAKE